MTFQPGSQVRNFFNEVDFTVGAEATDVINVALQLQSNGKNVDARSAVLAYLSDDAAGDGVASTAPTGGVAEGTDGEIISEIDADKVFLLKTNATGAIDVDITDTGTPTFHLVVVLPTGKITVSDAITFA